MTKAERQLLIEDTMKHARRNEEFMRELAIDYVDSLPPSLSRALLKAIAR